MAGNKELTILQMNDSHGYLELHPELFWAGDHAVYRPAGGLRAHCHPSQSGAAGKPGCRSGL